MSVQGGGGKKVPPAGPSTVRTGAAQAPAAQTPGHQTTTSTNAPQTQPAQPAPATPSASHRQDAFESRRQKGGGGEYTRNDDPIPHATSASGIEQMVRMLDKARADVLHEHRMLRAQAHEVVQRLVAAGFSAAQLESARAELHGFRLRLAAQRKRLQALQRRLKNAAFVAGQAGDADFARILGAQLRRLRSVEPGLQRALMAFKTLEHAYGSGADGTALLLRVPLGGATEERHAISDAIADAVPGAAVAELLLSIVREGAETLPRPPTRTATMPEVLTTTRALVDALLPSTDALADE